ncbi:MAG: hypothetical protein H0V27_15375 [Pyrinomonadaceae bacterium]|nr:hypothetical protein [Pyrinomonadaceae bacterium]
MIKLLLRVRRILITPCLIVMLLSGTLAESRQTFANLTQTAKSDASINGLTGKERVEAFEKIWRTINEKYYDAKFNGVDWNAVRERYRPRVEAAQSDEEFYSLMRRMTGELRDAHTRFLSPRQRQQRKRLQATSAGVIISEVEGTPVILSVGTDSDAARAGVLPGMVVRTVDDKPIAERIKEVRDEIVASSSERAMRLLIYSRLLAGEPDTTVMLGLVRADGTPLDVTLTRRIASAAPKVTARLLPSGYAYIKFNRFHDPVANEIKEALVKFKDAPGLILDLRNNGGGDGEEALRIAGFFFNEKVSFGRILTRTGKPPSALFGLIKFPKEFQAGRKGGQLYRAPVVILVNEASGSASELFASALQEQSRASVVGTQSCGCVLGVLEHREVKGGGEFTVSEIAFLTSKGRRLEGDGVTPNETVALTLADVRSGRDAALARAEGSLRNRAEATPRSAAAQ